MMATALQAVAADRFTLVIDAGHGGHDAGAVGTFSKEKNINLNVALAFGRYVERSCPDVKVVYTRKTDVFIPLHTRADIANHAKADLFISIHTNALPNGRIARGLETYTLGMHRAKDNLEVAKRENSVILVEKDYQQRYQGFDPRSSESYIMFELIQDKNMEKSIELAKAVQRRTCASANRPDKGVKQAGFLVLRETSMPSCLIELGFISTPDEERFLNSNDGIEKLGYGIYQAFLDYRKKPATTATLPAYLAEDNTKTQEQPKVVETPKVVQQPKAQEQPKVIEQPKAVEQPKVIEQPKAPEQPQVQEKPAPAPTAAVFKVQIFVSSTRLPANSPKLKDLDGVDCYQENGMYKYTVGATADYQEASRQRRQLAERFPQAFIVAFKDGQRTDVQKAIQEYKNSKK